MAGKQKLTSKQVSSALKKHKGAVYLTAQSLGVTSATIYNYIKRYKACREVKDHYDNEIVDIAELKLREAVLGGDQSAVRYVLSTKGKDRGYSQRTEITGKDGKPLKVTFKENRN